MGPGAGGTDCGRAAIVKATGGGFGTGGGARGRNGFGGGRTESVVGGGRVFACIAN
jgi:hypothetical protein